MKQLFLKVIVPATLTGLIIFSGCGGKKSKAKVPCDPCITAEQAKATGCKFPESKANNVERFFPTCNEPRPTKVKTNGIVYDLTRIFKIKQGSAFTNAFKKIDFIGNSGPEYDDFVGAPGATSGTRRINEVMVAPDLVIVEVSEPDCTAWMSKEQKSKYTCNPKMEGNLFARYEEECWQDDSKNTEYTPGFFKSSAQTQRMRELLVEPNQPKPETMFCDRGLDKNSKFWQFNSEKYKTSGLVGTADTHGPVLSHDISVRENDDNRCNQKIFSSADWLFKNIYSKEVPEDVRRKTSTPHHALCRPGPIIAQCMDTGYLAANRSSEKDSIDDVAKKMDGEAAVDGALLCPPGVGPGIANSDDAQQKGAGAQALVGPVLNALLGGSSGSGVDASKEPPKLANAISSDAKGVMTSRNSAGIPSGRKSGGSLADSPFSGLPESGPSSKRGSGGGNDASNTGSALLPTSNTQTDSNALAVASEEEAGKSKDVEYETTKLGGGSGKPNGGLDFGSLFGNAGGNAANQGAGVAVSGFGAFGKKLLGGNGQLTDAEIEALLGKNAGSSLFDIASRRYYKWGGDLLSQEAKERLRK